MTTQIYAAPAVKGLINTKSRLLFQWEGLADAYEFNLYSKSDVTMLIEAVLY